MDDETKKSKMLKEIPEGETADENKIKIEQKLKASTRGLIGTIAKLCG
jgi:hypothetical protein